MFVLLSYCFMFVLQLLYVKHFVILSLKLCYNSRAGGDLKVLHSAVSEASRHPSMSACVCDEQGGGAQVEQHCSTHSWRCPAEGAGWPRGSSPHRCCPHSYSAGCRSVSPDANNSHWCSGTCTLHSQGRGGKQKEKRPFMAQAISNVLSRQIVYIFHVPYYNKSDRFVCQGQQGFLGFKEWQKTLVRSFVCKKSTNNGKKTLINQSKKTKV